MVRGTELSEAEKAQIRILIAAGHNNCKIASLMHRTEGCVRAFRKRENAPAKVSHRGAKRKCSDRVVRAVCRAASNKVTSSAELKSQFKLPVCSRTIRNYLEASPFLVYKKKKCKPPLTLAHRTHRINWSTGGIGWVEQWKSIVWSDEKKFNLDGPDGWAFYWHDIRKEELLFSKRQHGGGCVMVWGGFGWLGKTELAFIDGRMNAQMYTDMLMSRGFTNRITPLSTVLAIPMNGWQPIMLLILIGQRGLLT